MTANETRTVIAFETSLKPGDKVEVHWTNCGGYYMAEAEVVRVNTKSVRVRLLHDVPNAYTSGWLAGNPIVVPTILASSWSCNNRVAPLGGYRPVEAA